MANGQHKKHGGKLPISRHPLFPFTVALWFGALFGLGGLAIRPALIEKAMLAVQLQAVMPAALPPIGANGKILLSLALAVIGGALGALLARRMARSAAAKRQHRNAAENLAPFTAIPDATVDHDRELAGETASLTSWLPAREDGIPPDSWEQPPSFGEEQPYLDTEELDLQGFEADPSPSFEEFAPVANEPGWDIAPEPAEDIAEEAVFPASGETGDEDGVAREDDAFFTAPAQADYESEDGPFEEQIAYGKYGTGEDGDEDDAGEYDDQAVHASYRAALEAEEEIGRDEQAESEFHAAPTIDRSDPQALSWIMSAELGDLTQAELLARLALSLERGSSSPPPPASSPLADELARMEAESAARQLHDPDPLADDGVADAPTPAALDEAWENSDGMAEASAADQLDRMEAENEFSQFHPSDPLAGDSAADVPAPATMDEEWDNDVGSEAASPAAEEPVAERAETADQPGAAIPAALRPITFDEDSDNYSLPSIVPPRHVSVKSALENAIGDAYEPLEAAPEDEDAEDDATYSSLLNMARPDRRRRGFNNARNRPLVMFPRDGTPIPGPFSEPEAANGPKAVPSSYDPSMHQPAAESENSGFDQPGEPRTHAGIADALAPEETERALKDGPATLRGTSGNG